MMILRTVKSTILLSNMILQSLGSDFTSMIWIFPDKTPGATMKECVGRPACPRHEEHAFHPRWCNSSPGSAMYNRWITSQQASQNFQRPAVLDLMRNIDLLQTHCKKLLTRSWQNLSANPWSHLGICGAIWINIHRCQVVRLCTLVHLHTRNVHPQWRIYQSYKNEALWKLRNSNNTLGRTLTKYPPSKKKNKHLCQVSTSPLLHSSWPPVGYWSPLHGNRTLARPRCNRSWL